MDRMFEIQWFDPSQYLWITLRKSLGKDEADSQLWAQRHYYPQHTYRIIPSPQETLT